MIPLTYLGNCEWEPAGEVEPKRQPGQLPILREPWLGRADKLDEFLRRYPIGKNYLGGYIIDNEPKAFFEGVMSADLVIALPPDFYAFIIDNSTSSKVTTKSAQVDGENLVPE